MRVGVLFILLVLAVGTVTAQEKRAYSLLDAKGKEIRYSDMMKKLGEQDVVFFGEIHNCPIAHWMEYEVVKDLYARHQEQLMIGAEMFEADNQLVLDEYLGGVIPAERFKKELKLWPNYDTDYVKVVEFAKKNGIPFVATNVPRRYANIVSRGGFAVLDSLSEEARRYIAPLPIDYVPNERVDQYFSSMKMPGMKADTTGNLSRSQAVKDATMGWFIAQRLKSGKLVHLNGSFHSDGKLGIITYLNQYRPGLRIATVTVVRQDQVERLDKENEGLADFYICVPNDMTKTF